MRNKTLYNILRGTQKMALLKLMFQVWGIRIKVSSQNCVHKHEVDPVSFQSFSINLVHINFHNHCALTNTFGQDHGWEILQSIQNGNNYTD